MSGDFVETFGPVLAWVLRTTVEASLVAALVLVAQRLLRDRVSARWRYNLWLLVVARLLLPAVPGAPFSPFNLVQLPDAARRQPPPVPGAAPVLPRSSPRPLPATPVPGPALGRDEPPVLRMASNPVTAPRQSPVQDAAPPLRTPTPAAALRSAESEFTPHTIATPSEAAPGAGGPVQAVSLWTAPAPRWKEPAAEVERAPRAAAARPPAAMSAAAAPPPAGSPWYRRVNWPAVAAVVWVGGAAFVAARLLWVTLRLSAAVRGMRPVRHPILSELLADCAAQLRLRRLPDVVEAPDGFGPALVGLLRPRVVLPTCVLRGMFRRDEMRLILMHELAHMKRHDVAANWLLAALGVVHWFNPILALAFRRMRLDRELACDELVLSAARGESARVYGPTLLKLLQALSRGSALPGMVGVLEGKTPMIRRFAMIARFDRRHLNRSPLFGAVLSALAGGVALTGAVRGQQAPPPAREVAVELTPPAGEGGGAAFGIAPSVEDGAGEPAGEALESAREQLESVREALRERERAAQEVAAEADRAIAEAQREAAERERDGRRAMAEARRGLDEARREVGRREQEIRRALDEAVRAMAEHKAEGRGDEGDDDGEAEREQELKSQVEAHESALAELAAERDEALREAQSQIEQAAAGLEAAQQEARAELERAVAERNEAIQEAARAAQEAAAEHAAAVDQLAAAQAAVGGGDAPAADPVATPVEPEGIPVPSPEPAAEVPPGVEAAPSFAQPTEPVPTPAPAAVPPGAGAPPAAPVAPQAPVAAADPAAPAGLAQPSTSAPTALPEPVPGPTPAAEAAPAAAPAAALPPAEVTPAQPPAAGATPPAAAGGRGGYLPPAADPGGYGDSGGGGYVPPGGGYGGYVGGDPGGYAGGAAPAAPAAGASGGGRGMVRGGAGTSRGAAGMGSMPGPGGGVPGEMPRMMGAGRGMPGAPGMMPGMARGGAAPDAGRVEDETSRAADARAREALRRPVPVGFDNEPLDGALDALGEAAGVDIMPDWKALEAAGVRRDTPVSLRLRQGAPLEQALTWLLRSAGGDELGFAIDHGIVVVSTPDRLSRMVITRAYPVGAHGPGVEALVRESVAPESWREQGGTGSVRFFKNQLFVTATEPTHRQVERLLGLMESHGAAPGAPEAAPQDGPGGMGMYPGMGPGGANPGPSRRPLGLGGAGRQ